MRYISQSQSNVGPSRSAFSLIELLCVLLITGLLTAALTVQWNATIRIHQIQSAASRVRAFDEMVRARAKTSQRVFIRYNLDADEVSAWISGERLSYSVQVPVHSIVMAESQINTGAVEIPYFPDGSSLSYIVRIGFEKTAREIAIIGGTGQIREIEGLERNRLFKMIRDQSF